MRIAEAVKLLASPFSVQDAFLGDVPENASIVGYTGTNDVYRMLLVYLESTMVSEGDGGSEGLASWLARTEIPPDVYADRDHPLWQSICWLTIAVQMLIKLEKPYLFTRHGLRSAGEWKLVRHLAAEACHAMGWPLDLRYQCFETLWRDLGGGVIDDEP